MKLSLIKVLLGIFFLTIFLFLLTYFLRVPALQAILGIPLILFFPGFVLITALIPKRKETSNTEKIALGFVLSIVIDSLAGLILNYTSFGITLDSVIITISIFVLVVTTIGIVRQIVLPRDEQSVLAFNISLVSPAPGPLNLTFSIVMILVVLGGLATGIYYSFAPKGGESFTGFYIVKQDNGQLYSQNGSSDSNQVTVTLGITNNERTAVNYKIRVSTNKAIYAEIEPIILADRQKWQESFSFPSQTNQRTEVEFLLYKNNDAEPYLESLRLWVDPPASIAFSQ